MFDNREEVAIDAIKFCDKMLERRKHPPTGNVCYLLPRSALIHDYVEQHRERYVENPRQGSTKKVNDYYRRRDLLYILWANDKAFTPGYGRFFVKTITAHQVEESRRGVAYIRRKLIPVQQDLRRLADQLSQGNLEVVPDLVRLGNQFNLLKETQMQMTEIVETGDSLRLR